MCNFLPRRATYASFHRRRKKISESPAYSRSVPRSLIFWFRWHEIALERNCVMKRRLMFFTFFLKIQCKGAETRGCPRGVRKFSESSRTVSRTRLTCKTTDAHLPAIESLKKKHEGKFGRLNTMPNSFMRKQEFFDQGDVYICCSST